MEPHGRTAARGLAALPRPFLDDSNLVMRGFSHSGTEIYSSPLPPFIYDIRMTIYAIDLIFATETQSKEIGNRERHKRRGRGVNRKERKEF